MRQYTETYHKIEQRRKIGDGWASWHPLMPSHVFRECELLAYSGRLIDAIEKAQDVWLNEMGQLRDVEFRCVTTQKTITSHVPLHEGWNE